MKKEMINRLIVGLILGVIGAAICLFLKCGMSIAILIGIVVLAIYMVVDTLASTAVGKKLFGALSTIATIVIVVILVAFVVLGINHYYSFLPFDFFGRF